MGWWGSGLVGWIQEVNSRAKSTSFGSKVQELHKQGQGTMDWLGSGLVGWIQELYQQSPRALRAKSKSFTSKVREPWAGKGLVWCGGLKSFTSKVQELCEQSHVISVVRECTTHQEVKPCAKPTCSMGAMLHSRLQFFLLFCLFFLFLFFLFFFVFFVFGLFFCFF